MGFIGSNFIRAMLTRGDEVEITNLDRLSYGSNPANLKGIDGRKGYRFVKGDICDGELVTGIVRDLDAIVNFAAESHVDRSISSPQSFFESNFVGVGTLLEVCRKANVKFLQVSTDEVYGPSPSGYAFREADALCPSSPYAASKAAADMLVKSYHATYGLPAFITRSTNNFGPFQFPEKFIPKTIVRALMDLGIPIYGTGRQVRDWIHVHDHCEALQAVLTAGRSGETYNIAGGNALENERVVDLILEILRKPKSIVSHVEDRPGHDFRYALDVTKIETELNWKPKRRFQEALEETVNWYLQNESWWREVSTEKVLSPTPWREKW
jgi:dTDP-glucose 4,6-dehydratase